MKTRIGMFVTSTEDGSTVTDKVFKYSTYQEMLNDTDHGKYGIVDNVVYHNVGGTWVTGFANVCPDNDYTAFEVYPTDHDIMPGSSELGEVLWNDSSMTTLFRVPASMTEEFSLWITKSRLESDIVIDWGDGVVEKLSELTPTSGTGNDGQIDVLVYVAHTYTVPNRTYVIKIYGKDYCGLRHNSHKLSEDNKLVCRCFTNDLPIASHLLNVASLFYGNLRLLNVKFPSYAPLFNQVVNWSSCFSNCQNLISCTGWPNTLRPAEYGNIFRSDYNLKTTDFRLSKHFTGGFPGVFAGCNNLEKDIASLFDQYLISTTEVDVYLLFDGCDKLYGTVPAHLLWDNPYCKFKNIRFAFRGCSDEIRAQVPVSWGGTLVE